MCGNIEEPSVVLNIIVGSTCPSDTSRLEFVQGPSTVYTHTQPWIEKANAGDLLESSAEDFRARVYVDAYTGDPQPRGDYVVQTVARTQVPRRLSPSRLLCRLGERIDAIE